MSNFWSDPSVLFPKQQHRWIISFGDTEVVNGKLQGYQTTGSIIPPHYIKSVERPNYDIGTIEAKFLYTHTINFNKRLVWQPINITLYDVSEPEDYIYAANGIIDDFNAGNNKVQKSTQNILYNILERFGYFSPQEANFNKDKIPAFKSYHFKANIVNTLGIKPVNLEDNKIADKNYMSIHELYAGDDSSKYGTIIETWRLHNPLLIDVKNDKLDYTSDAPLMFNLRLAYDWAELIDEARCQSVVSIPPVEARVAPAPKPENAPVPAETPAPTPAPASAAPVAQAPATPAPTASTPPAAPISTTPATDTSGGSTRNPGVEDAQIRLTPHTQGQSSSKSSSSPSGNSKQSLPPESAAETPIPTLPTTAVPTSTGTISADKPNTPNDTPNIPASSSPESHRVTPEAFPTVLTVPSTPITPTGPQRTLEDDRRNFRDIPSGDSKIIEPKPGSQGLDLPIPAVKTPMQNATDGKTKNNQFDLSFLNNFKPGSYTSQDALTGRKPEAEPLRKTPDIIYPKITDEQPDLSVNLNFPTTNYTSDDLSAEWPDKESTKFLPIKPTVKDKDEYLGEEVRNEFDIPRYSTDGKNSITTIYTKSREGNKIVYSKIYEFEKTSYIAKAEDLPGSLGVEGKDWRMPTAEEIALENQIDSLKEEQKKAYTEIRSINTLLMLIGQYPAKYPTVQKRLEDLTIKIYDVSKINTTIEQLRTLQERLKQQLQKQK